MYGNLTLSNAFAEADNILTTAAKGIAEIITVPGYINVDFEDVKTVMQSSGVAIMGSASAEGEGRAFKAVQSALASPLLNDNDIEGARYILLNITSGEKEVLMDEVSEITDYIQNQAGLTADIIWGNCYDETLGDKISVTLIATGFQTKEERFSKAVPGSEKKVIPLSIENKSTIENNIPNLNITIEDDEVVPAVNTLEQMLTLKSELIEEEVSYEIQNEIVEVQTSEEVIEESAAVKKAPAMILKKHIVEESELSTFIKEDVKKEAPAAAKQVNLFDFIPAPELKIEEKIEQEPFRLLDKEDVEFKVINKSPQESIENEELDEQMRKNKERINRLKELSMRLRTPNGVNDLEQEPAYLRKKQSMDATPHSSESQLSRYTVNEENGVPQIRPNNPFLHDNVD
jgi:cell division protein FtsZ